MSDNPVGKAIAESMNAQAHVRAETRKRNRWAYFSVEEVQSWASKNNIVGSDDVVVRAYFKDAAIAAALNRMPTSEQRKIQSTTGIPPTYNPEAAVERGKDSVGREFFAIWNDKGEPTSPPTF